MNKPHRYVRSRDHRLHRGPDNRLFHYRWGLVARSLLNFRFVQRSAWRIRNLMPVDRPRWAFIRVRPLLEVRCSVDVGVHRCFQHATRKHRSGASEVLQYT